MSEISMYDHDCPRIISENCPKNDRATSRAQRQIRVCVNKQALVALFVQNCPSRVPDQTGVSQNVSPTETETERNNDFQTGRGITVAKFGLNSEFDEFEGKTGRNEAVVAPKLSIDDSDGGTGQFEAVHAEKCSDTARAQHYLVLFLFVVLTLFVTRQGTAMHVFTE